MRNWIIVLLIWLGLIAPTVAQADKDKNEEDHKKLIAMREAMEEALKNNDVDAMLKHLDDDVVVTFMNAEVARKPEGVRAYFDKMMKGPDAIVKSYTPQAKVAEPTRILGNTGIAFGTSHDTFKLTDGRDFSIDVKWTAVVLKKNNEWKVA